MRAPNFYAHPGFERAGLRRRESEWIRARMLDRESLFVPVWRSQSLVVEVEDGEPQAVILGAEAVAMLLGSGDSEVDEWLAHGWDRIPRSDRRSRPFRARPVGA